MKQKSEKSADIFIIYRYLFKSQKRHFLLLNALIFIILLSVFCDCIIPLILKRIFEVAVPHANIHVLNIWMVFLFAAFLFLAFFSFLQTRIASRLGSNMISLLRLKILNFVQNIDIRKVDRESILPRFGEDTSLLENSSINSTWTVLRFALTGVVSFILLFYLNWQLTVLVLLFIPLTIFLPKFFLTRATKYVEDKKREEDSLLSFTSEEIAMQDVIYILRIKNYRRRLFKILLKKAHRFLDLYNTYLSYIGKSAVLSSSLIMIFILGFGAYLIVLNYMDIGALIGFISLVGNIGNAVNLISDQLPSLINGSEALKRIEHLISNQTRRIKKLGLITLSRFKSDISFKDVNYENNGIKIISDINLKIPIGKLVALVGLSGSGKSTILNLLLRNFPISSGKIEFDNLDIEKIDLNSLLKQIGLVEQQPKLFTTTIKENIRLGKLNASGEEIIEAAKQAEIHEDILTFPQGYDTELKNLKLSGGQLQRIVIARALISNPAILCLDEATSALDPITESHLNETIKKMIGRVTIVSCTHRLRSIIDAEYIYVLEKGRLIETGKHQDLMQKKGLYYHLWEKQSGVQLSEDMREASIDPQWLKQIPLFKDLNEITLNTMAQEFSLERKDANQVIFSEGDLGDKFYIIVAGVVEVSYFDKLIGQIKVIATLSDGDYFGEIALIYNRKRNATITTKGACILLSLNYQQYQKFFAQLPQEIKNIIMHNAEQHAEVKRS